MLGAGAGYVYGRASEMGQFAINDGAGNFAGDGNEHGLPFQYFFQFRDLLFFDVALPDPHDLPAFLREGFRDGLVSLFVALDFLLPVIKVIARGHVATVVSMPETSVREEGKAQFWKHKIGMPHNLHAAPPTRDLARLEYLDQAHLGGFVAARFDGSHDVGTILVGKCIGHFHSP